MARARITLRARGNDTYWADDAGDTVIENDNEGDDTVRASVDFTLSANVENLTLIGTGSLNGTGNGAANILIGNAGSNILDGGAGADHMSGGAGDDTYVVDNAGDTTVENAASGTDTVRASVSFALSANVETLILTGGADLDGTGNGLANTIVGNAGRNLLDGGTGADQLIGGAGDDIYVIDNAGDAVVENANEGSDTVRAAISYALGANVENLVLTGVSDIDATGNGLANVLDGNEGNNVLDGGAGADQMSGGLGDDTYVVDNASDAVLEKALEGDDTIRSSISLVLSDNVENLDSDRHRESQRNRQ